MSEDYFKKSPSQFPRTQSNILKLLSSSNQQCKTQRLIYITGDKDTQQILTLKKLELIIKIVIFLSTSIP